MAVFTRDKAVLISFLTGGHFMTHVLIAAYPALALLVAEELDFTSKTQILSLITFTGIIYGTGSLLTGYLSDRRDPLAMVTIGLIVSTAAAFGIAASVNYWMLVLFFGLLGAGLSFYHPAGLSFISKVFGAKHRGKALGINGLGGDIGLVVSPVVTAAIATQLGWRIAYVIWGLVGLVFVVYAVVLFGTKVLRAEANGGGANGEGAGPSSGRPRVRGRLDMAAMEVEERVGPTSKAEYWKGMRLLLTSAVMIVITITIFRGLLFHGMTEPLPTYLAQEKGLADDQDAAVLIAGTLTSLMYLVGAFAEPIGGWVKDRYSAKAPLVVTNIICALAAVMLLSVDSITLVTVAMLVFGFSFFMSMAVINALVADVTPPEVRGTFYGVSFFTRDGIGFLAPFLVGVLADATGTFSTAYWMVAIFGLLTAADAMFLRQEKRASPAAAGK